jgi:hypothetical protein
MLAYETKFHILNKSEVINSELKTCMLVWTHLEIISVFYDKMSYNTVVH